MAQAIRWVNWPFFKPPISLKGEQMKKECRVVNVRLIPYLLHKGHTILCPPYVSGGVTIFPFKETRRLKKDIVVITKMEMSK